MAQHHGVGSRKGSCEFRSPVYAYANPSSCRSMKTKTHVAQSKRLRDPSANAISVATEIFMLPLGAAKTSDVHTTGAALEGKAQLKRTLTL